MDAVCWDVLMEDMFGYFVFEWKALKGKVWK